MRPRNRGAAPRDPKIRFCIYCLSILLRSTFFVFTGADLRGVRTGDVVLTYCYSYTLLVEFLFQNKKTITGSFFGITYTVLSVLLSLNDTNKRF